MMQLPDSQATEPLPQDLGQGQPSEQGILVFRSQRMMTHEIQIHVEWI